MEANYSGQGMVVQFEVKGRVENIKEVGQNQVTIGQDTALLSALKKDGVIGQGNVENQTKPLGQVLPPKDPENNENTEKTEDGEANKIKDISEFKTKKDLFLYGRELGIALNDKHTMAKMYEELLAGVNNAN